MARIRTIKPEFWTSEQVVSCSRDARLLFIGIWNFCDDNGIHPANHLRLKMQIFPGDDISTENIQRMLGELSENNLIDMYVVDGVEYMRVTGWKKHQRIDQPTFKFPLECGDIPKNVRRTSAEHSPPDRKGKEGKGKKNLPKPFLAEGLGVIRDLCDELGPLPDDAKAVHDALEAALVAEGMEVAREVEVSDRGDGRVGRLDLVATRDGYSFAIEIDRTAPRQKSITKLLGSGCDAKVVVLRGGAAEAPAGIDLVCSVAVADVAEYPADFEAAWD